MLFVKILSFILRNIPLKAGYFFFEAIFMLNLLFPSKRKETLRKNLAHIYGRPPTDAELRANYRNYARYYLELYVDKEKLMPNVSISDEYNKTCAYARELREKYGGFILVAMHMGNWDFGGCYMSAIFPGMSNVVVERLSPAAFKWFTETRVKYGMKVVTADKPKEILKVLKNHEALVLVADRDLDRTGYQMDFFGKKAYIPSGPAKLALTFNVPIMLGCLTRDKNDPYKFIPYFPREALNLDKLEKTPENELKVTKEYVALMEKCLAQYPEQWCMLQQVWVED